MHSLLRSRTHSHHIVNNAGKKGAPAIGHSQVADDLIDRPALVVIRRLRLRLRLRQTDRPIYI